MPYPTRRDAGTTKARLEYSPTIRAKLFFCAMALAAANCKRMTSVATHASDATVDRDRRRFAGGGKRGVAALAIGGLLRPGAESVMAMAGVAIGSSHLFPVGVDAAMGAGFILLLLGEMAVAAELGDFSRRGHL